MPHTTYRLAKTRMKYSEKYPDLVDEIWIMTTIKCSECSAVKDLHECDSYEAAEQYYKMGWRFGRNEDDMAEVHCPDCVKKNK